MANITVNNSNNNINGTSLADVIRGVGGQDYIDGGDGDDKIDGGLGNDQMWAGAGSDRLIADGGNDELSGNYSLEGFGDNASDILDIRTTAGTAAIVDFEIVINKIDFTDFNLGNSSYWTAKAVQSSPSVTTLTLTGQAQEQVTVILQGVSDGYTMTLNDMIGGSTSLFAAPPVNPNGNGIADIFVILPQVISGFEDGLDRIDLAFLNQPVWDGSTLFQFWNSTTGDNFELLMGGVGFGLITQPDIII
jgi:Ca2+-binding RTX toxin-like protein